MIPVILLSEPPAVKHSKRVKNGMEVNQEHNIRILSIVAYYPTRNADDKGLAN